MRLSKYATYRVAFEVIARSHFAGVLRALSKCRGVILTLHRVLPEAPSAFSPNSILQITPTFLDQVITGLRGLGFDLVGLDEAISRLEGRRGRPFAVLSFDDGYRDNIEHALPILEKHQTPFTLYIPTAYIDGDGQVWWQAVEDIVGAHTSVDIGDVENPQVLLTSTLAEKHAAYECIYGQLRRMPEPLRAQFMQRFAMAYGYDLQAQCRKLIMNWQELREVASNPLCTIGAHTINHYELAKLDEADARKEIAGSLDRLGSELGTVPRHLSYPIGGLVSAGRREYDLAASLGLRTAVTTLPGGLYPSSLAALTSLPRISLNGQFQSPRFVNVFATGSIFSMLRRQSAN